MKQKKRQLKLQYKEDKHYQETVTNFVPSSADADSLKCVIRIFRNFGLMSTSP